MKPALLLLAAAALLSAQDGEQAFAQTCGSGYCHGGRGAGGGAPRLAARGFEQDYIANTVARGVAGTSMPSFSTLPPAERNAIVAYVARLNGVAAPGRGAAAPAAPKLSPDAARGQALFTDAVRGFGRCSTCHEVGGFGIPIAAPIASVPANPVALHSLTTPRVVTATVAGSSMPALVVAAKSDSVMFYDLTTPPPVRRIVEPRAFVRLEGSTWRHDSAVRGVYTDAELTAILAYLRAQ